MLLYAEHFKSNGRLRPHRVNLSPESLGNSTGSFGKIEAR
jgi:hypothetical protein